MKFSAPNLTPGKRATTERNRKWMLSLAVEIRAKEARLAELSAVLEKAQSGKVEYEQSAARDPAVALKLVGAESQLARLAPEIAQAELLLTRDVATAARQVTLLRGSEMRELLTGPFYETLIDSLTNAIRPFFADDWARQYAKQIMQSTAQFSALRSYLNPPPVVTTDTGEVLREINAVVAQLTAILAGETLIEMERQNA